MVDNNMILTDGYEEHLRPKRMGRPGFENVQRLSIENSRRLGSGAR